MEKDAAKQFEQMTTAPVGRMIAKLALPTICSMMITAVYNLADTFFVSQINASASAACGIIFSLMAIIQAVGFTIGMGSGSLISRLLGAKDLRQCDQIASSGFFASLVCGGVIMIAGLLTTPALCRLLGATDTILPYAERYAHYVLLSAPLMCASFVLNNVLRSQGRAVLSMIGLTTGGLLNIGLDALLIFGADMGITGAAIATFASQSISFGLLLLMFLTKRSVVSLRITAISRSLKTYGSILVTGFPSFCRQGLASIATASLNLAAFPYGDEAIAAMSIVGRLFQFVLSALIGFGQGFQPVIGFNYGARRYDRVRTAFFFTLKVGLIALTVISVAGLFLFPYLLPRFCPESDAVAAIAIPAAQLQCLVLPLNALIVVTNMTFQVIGRSWQATLISSGKQGLFFLPLIVVLPALCGLHGIWLTQPIADALTAVLCIPFLISFFRDLGQMIAKRDDPARSFIEN